jgi:heme-degrading monooxygenase HmoA
MMGSLPGARFTEGVTFAVDGPTPAGPEQAGAVLVLQGTLAAEDMAQMFWQRAAQTLREAMDSPGFIRFIGFNDGLCGYALGFWRTTEDAEAFAKGRAHGEARRELYRTGNQYTHFAGLYRATKENNRHFFCEACGAVTNAPATECSGCGNPLVDVFDGYVRPVAP